MPEEAPVTTPSENEQGNTTPAIPVVPTQATLTRQEIERICRAFIRLITAKEKRHNDQQKDD